MSRNDEIDILGLCYSESNLNYKAVHQNKYTNICGVDPLWKEYLAERNIPYNSIQAGWAVFQYYYDKNNHDKLKAILEFKGVKSNTKVQHISKKLIKITTKLKETK